MVIAFVCMYNYYFFFIDMYYYSSTSPHNKEVKDTLMKELKNDPDNTFSDNIISCQLHYILFHCNQFL